MDPETSTANESKPSSSEEDIMVAIELSEEDGKDTPKVKSVALQKLVEHSDYFRARLERWRETGKSNLVLRVEKGYIQGYSDCLDFISDMTSMFVSVKHASKMLVAANRLLCTEVQNRCLEYLGAMYWLPEEKLELRADITRFLNYTLLPTEFAERLNTEVSSRISLLRTWRGFHSRQHLNKASFNIYERLFEDVLQEAHKSSEDYVSKVLHFVETEWIHAFNMADKARFVKNFVVTSDTKDFEAFAMGIALKHGICTFKMAQTLLCSKTPVEGVSGFCAWVEKCNGHAIVSKVLQYVIEGRILLPSSDRKRVALTLRGFGELFEKEFFLIASTLPLRDLHHVTP